jgi:hypothetical protein
MSMNYLVRTWHGYMRPAGTPVSLTSGKDMSITDDHGCGTFWCLDSAGDKMNVWECELVMRGWNHYERSTYARRIHQDSPRKAIMPAAGANM